MSCNGCRVLRRGCGDSCALRPCLEWIDTPKAQGNATMFVSKFFGRSYLINHVSSVPDSERTATFQSLLFEACGRTVNPVSGAVGLATTGNWNVCLEAARAVLAGEELQPMPFPDDGLSMDISELSGGAWRANYSPEFFMQGSGGGDDEAEMKTVADRKIYPGEASGVTASFGGGGYDGGKEREPKLLNLFV